MWEEGVHIYGTPEVPNNFPLLGRGSRNVGVGQAFFSVGSCGVCVLGLMKELINRAGSMHWANETVN